MDVDTVAGSQPGPSGSSQAFYDIPLINQWRYDMRRESQQIIPNLYLGPFQASINLDKLQTLGITHIKEASLIYPRFPDRFVYLTLDISDNTNQNVITIFPQCKAFLDQALAAGGTVLAHCNGGISTSPAIVVGYLMSRFAWTYENALAYVQSRRYCVSPISFQTQLREYEPITAAQHMSDEVRRQAGTTGVSGVSGGGGGGGDHADEQRMHKRMVEDGDDEDEYRRKAPSRRHG